MWVKGAPNVPPRSRSPPALHAVRIERNAQDSLGRNDGRAPRFRRTKVLITEGPFNGFLVGQQE